MVNSKYNTSNLKETTTIALNSQKLAEIDEKLDLLVAKVDGICNNMLSKEDARHIYATKLDLAYPYIDWNYRFCNS